MDRAPDGEVPGIVEVEGGAPVRLVTNSPRETESALGNWGVSVIRTGPMDLQEILSHLMREKGDTAREYHSNEDTR